MESDHRASRAASAGIVGKAKPSCSSHVYPSRNRLARLTAGRLPAPSRNGVPGSRKPKLAMPMPSTARGCSSPGWTRPSWPEARSWWTMTAEADHAGARDALERRGNG